MPTWNDVQGYVRDSFAHTEEEAGCLVVRWRSRDDDRTGAQRIHVMKTERFDRPCAVVVAELFPEQMLAFREALVFSESLAVGALLLHGDQYVLRWALPLAFATRDELVRVVEYLARAATRLRLRALALRYDTAQFSDCTT